ncbi:cytochrome P450 4C1-like [Xylocopa sonorina]|uniref:cytochrome P450 4C1-like n=1 Tax=Xylocopa sonorina TaxID=1818115 RepID=UPI00403A9E6D
MFTTILLSVVLVIILHYTVLHYGKYGRTINSIPGPPVWPIIGNTYKFQISVENVWKLIREMGKQYYPIYKVWSFTMPYLNINHPDDIETILGNPTFTQKSILYKFLQPWFGTGLLTSSGRKWQIRRKILTPAFHFNVLQQFTDIILEEGDQLIKKLKSEGRPLVLDLLPLISEHTLNVICETAMGISLKDKGEFQHKYRNAVFTVGHLMAFRLLRPWFYYDFIFNLTPYGWQQARLLKILHGFTEKIIQERKQYHDQTNDRYLTGFNDNPSKKCVDDGLQIRKKRLAMLDLLIAAHRSNQIDEEGIREEVDTFMFRGHDTTTTAIAFTIMLLAEHPEIQSHVRAEVISVLEANGGKLTPSALQCLPYLERCIKESLRLYPSVPFIARKTEKEIKLHKYLIPVKTMVNIHIYDTHRDPRYWPNPNVFDPDRFLPENAHGRHPYSYVPFSAGPRNCIGQKFAMLELKSTLAHLLSNFTFEPVDYLKDVSINLDLVLRPLHPIRTKFIPLETAN